MAGTNSDPKRVIGFLVGYSSAAVTAGQTLLEAAIPANCRIGGIAARAETAGTGTGNTVLDVQRNGTTVWHTAANKPTLAVASTNEFANTTPDDRAMSAAKAPFDRLRILVSSIPTVTGHARVSLVVTLEEP